MLLILGGVWRICERIWIEEKFINRNIVAPSFKERKDLLDIATLETRVDRIRRIGRDAQPTQLVFNSSQFCN